VNVDVIGVRRRFVLQGLGVGAAGGVTIEASSCTYFIGLFSFPKAC
jgi:hypothetical protein